jgi:hypothetical protein
MSEGTPTEEVEAPASEEGTAQPFAGTAGETATSRLPDSLLSDDRYREVLRAMVDRGGHCSLSELNRTLVDDADWPPSTTVSDSPYQLTHIALVREYLPVLVQFGAVEYDDELGAVALVGANEPSDRPSPAPPLD